MCYSVPCPICDKIAWAGCDRHVDDVTKDVSRPRQCTCSAETVGPIDRRQRLAIAVSPPIPVASARA
jgi:hypothetical protein